MFVMGLGDLLFKMKVNVLGCGSVEYENKAEKRKPYCTRPGFECPYITEFMEEKHMREPVRYARGNKVVCPPYFKKQKK